MAFKRVLKSVSIIFTYIILLYGLIEVVIFLYSISSSIFVTLFVILLILGVIIVPFVYHFFRPKVLREFGLIRYENKFICSENYKDVIINKNYRSKVTVTRKLIFLNTPSQTDLVDCYSIDPNTKIDEFQYESPDAEEIDRKQLKPYRLAIYWRPKNRIFPYTEYIHQDSWVPQISFKAPANYTEYHCDVETGIYRASVNTSLLIERAIAFKRPRWKRLNKEIKLMKYTFNSTLRGCPQPNFHPDRKGFDWKIVNPKLGNNYMCVYFFKGGTDYWKKKILHLSLKRRIKSYFWK